MWRRALPATLAAFAWLAACNDTTGPDDPGTSAQRVEQAISDVGTQPHILTQSATAPALETYEKSVQACYGESSKLKVHYLGSPVDSDDDDDDDYDDEHQAVFLTLKIPGESLWKHPDGTPFLKSDCVQITVSIDPERLLAEFHPSGLQFDPDEPASLTLSYQQADPDFDGDGYVGQSDEQIEWEKLDIFRLPHDDGVWARTYSPHYVGAKTFKARMYSFSHYAIAH